MLQLVLGAFAPRRNLATECYSFRVSIDYDAPQRQLTDAATAITFTIEGKAEYDAWHECGFELRDCTKSQSHAEFCEQGSTIGFRPGTVSAQGFVNVGIPFEQLPFLVKRSPTATVGKRILVECRFWHMRLHTSNQTYKKCLHRVYLELKVE